LWKRHIPYAPYFEDSRYLAYATSPEFGRDLEQPLEVLPGLGVVEVTLSSFCSSEEIVGIAALTLASTAPLPADYAGQLTATSEETGRQIQAPPAALVDGWPTSQWPVGTVTRQSYSLTLPADDAPYTLTLHLVDQEEGALAGDPVLQGQIGGASCTVDAGSAQAANIRFGDSLRLLSYDVRREGSELVVAPFWLAEKRPAVAYKFFIHVYDPRTQEIVAQIETMPLEWRLPTSDWKSGELVADEMRLSLADVPTGEYGLALGVYDPETGERLPLSGEADSLRISEDGRLLLPEVGQNWPG